MRIVAISDTHGLHSHVKIPECDLLIHCGDWSSQGAEIPTRKFAQWLAEQPARHIVLVPGNHEVKFEKELPFSRSWITDESSKINLLVEQSIEIDGIKIYGSPWTPYFYDWAFNGARNINEQLAYSKQAELIPLMNDLWKKMPDDTDILVTHGPPYEILDKTLDGRFVGCVDLYNRIFEVKPDLVFFGHIHLNGGQEQHVNGVSFYNAAICDERYYPTNRITQVTYV